MTLTQRTSHVSRPLLLAAGLAIAGILGLGTHIVLQQVLGVPYPDVHLVPAWATFLNKWSAWGAVVAIWLYDERHSPERTWLGRWLRIALIFLLVKETLRAAVMQGVVTTSYAIYLALAVPTIVAVIAGCGLAGLVARYVRGPGAIVLGGLAIAAFSELVWRPFVTVPLVETINGLGLPNHDEVYGQPYGLHVLIPAFATYLEPVVGAVLFCRSIGGRSPSKAAFVTTMACFLFLTGRIVSPLVWSFFGPFPVPAAFMSLFQFALENAVLITGVFFSVRWFGRDDHTGFVGGNRQAR
ncbi:MAG: hypothetical protein GAK28_01830 [Luteibacter sp.]|uniref:hypothetical protein n=1 Tax=Luteibacter sp. TaxID=1886636 RepID=UPI00138248F5|nr:hypothetical protein [Luteibacter sp.]KAF1007488.1 MAG: hypothetical protein GAK28_01830 [Luteibacter sp.]